MDARDFFGYKHADEEPGRRDEADDGDDRRPPLPEEAITLDDPAILARIDTSDMLGSVRALPRQLAQARRIAAATTLESRYRDVDAVLVLGMGGSAIGGDLVAGIAAERLRVPLVVHRNYELPAWAGPRTLVIAASHSGVDRHERGAGHGLALGYLAPRLLRVPASSLGIAPGDQLGLGGCGRAEDFVSLG